MGWPFLGWNRGFAEFYVSFTKNFVTFRVLLRLLSIEAGV